MQQAIIVVFLPWYLPQNPPQHFLRISTKNPSENHRHVTIVAQVGLLYLS